MAEIPGYDDVLAAAKRIAPHAVRTPLVESPLLSALNGGRVFLKLEFLQRTGSFKFRGALNRIALIPENQRGGGVVAFSSGNHAQGVAAAAGLFGMKALIVMPSDAPQPKIEGTRALGAEIVLYDRVREDREAIAAALRAERGATLIKPYDDPGIIAGQGTLGLEIAEDAERLGVTLDAVLAPCSGGGLVSGIALALKGSGVSAKVHSVEPENFDGMRRSLAAGKRVAAPGGALSIADALMAPMPGEHVFALAKDLLAPGLTVTDAELEQAVAFAATRLKLLVEPGGAAALAALLAGKAEGKNVALVLSGGNADFAAIARYRPRAATKWLRIKVYACIRFHWTACAGLCRGMDAADCSPFLSVLVMLCWARAPPPPPGRSAVSAAASGFSNDEKLDARLCAGPHRHAGIPARRGWVWIPPRPERLSALGLDGSASCPRTAPASTRSIRRCKPAFSEPRRLRRPIFSKAMATEAVLLVQGGRVTWKMMLPAVSVADDGGGAAERVAPESRRAAVQFRLACSKRPYGR